MEGDATQARLMVWERPCSSACSRGWHGWISTASCSQPSSTSTVRCCQRRLQCDGGCLAFGILAWLHRCGIKVDEGTELPRTHVQAFLGDEVRYASKSHLRSVSAMPRVKLMPRAALACAFAAARWGDVKSTWLTNPKQKCTAARHLGRCAGQALPLRLLQLPPRSASPVRRMSRARASRPEYKPSTLVLLLLSHYYISSRVQARQSPSFAHLLHISVVHVQGGNDRAVRHRAL